MNEETGVVYLYGCLKNSFPYSWNQNVTLMASDASPYMWFGRALAVDYTNNSQWNFIVGASQDNAAGNQAGSVYLFTCQQNVNNGGKPMTTNNNNGSINLAAIIAPIVIGTFVLIVGTIALFFFFKSKKYWKELNESSTRHSTESISKTTND